MKKTLIAFAILFLIVSQSVCYPDDKYVTKGLHNGRQWLSLNKGEKESFVSGMHEGAALLLLKLGKQGICTSEKLDKTFDSTLVINTSPTEITSQIDSFYADSSNLNIPIIQAYEVAGHKFRGLSPSIIEEYIAELRKFFNK